MSVFTPVPCAHRARARWGDTLVADSTRAVRLDATDEPSALFFPRADVRLEALDETLVRRGEGDLYGFVSFDLDQVRVELLDCRDGDPERDVTIKRFPTWGDAADLVAVLDVQPDGAGRYVGAVRIDARRPVVEGSQILA